MLAPTSNTASPGRTASRRAATVNGSNRASPPDQNITCLRRLTVSFNPGST